MHHQVLLGVALSILLLVASPLSAQQPPKKVQNYLQEQEKKAKEEFPPLLPKPYPKNSLGQKIQELYKAQASSACGIAARENERLYIPRELVNAYGDRALRSTQIYDLQLSATNLLFLALTPAEIENIKQNNFLEKKYVQAKRVIGLRDNLVNYGHSILEPAAGFEILLYQKSCGSYFNSDAAVDITAPIIELKTSLKAETEKSSSITTVTGKFISPLHSIFRENSKRSVYAHMLLWETYYEQSLTQPKKEDLLLRKGVYISEFDATLTYRAYNKKQSLDMNGQLSSSVSFSVVNANGQVKANLKNAMSFSLSRFNTSIHKMDNKALSWDVTRLPSKQQIEEKLQNSFISAKWASSNGFATHLLPLELSRTMVGVPASLCQRNSWKVAPTGFDTSIWVSQPIVVAQSHQKEGQVPECSCTITGNLKKTAITKALNYGGFLNIELALVHKAIIDKEQLTIKILEQNVQVTNNPKILPINSEPINTNRKEFSTSHSNRRSFSYPITFLIEDEGVELSSNFNQPNLQIEFVNPKQASLFLTYPINNIKKTNNSINFELVTKSCPHDYIQEGEHLVPIKVKCIVPLAGGGITELVTNTITIIVPKLIEQPVEIPTPTEEPASPVPSPLEPPIEDLEDGQ